MKKILFLTLLSLFAGCASQQQVKASVADPPPARMNFTLMNLVNNQLNPDSVIGSSVSISSDLVLEKLELHSINANGVHIFTKQKITILAGSLGMFLSRPEGGTIIQRATPIFPLRTRDSLRRNFEFEFDLEKTPYLNKHFDNLSEMEINYLKGNGCDVDPYGFIRLNDYFVTFSEEKKIQKKIGKYGGEYFIRRFKTGEESQLGGYSELNYSSDSNGYLVYRGRFVVQDFSSKEVFFTRTPVQLGYLQYEDYESNLIFYN